MRWTECRRPRRSAAHSDMRRRGKARGGPAYRQGGSCCRAAGAALAGVGGRWRRTGAGGPASCPPSSCAGVSPGS